MVTKPSHPHLFKQTDTSLLWLALLATQTLHCHIFPECSLHSVNFLHATKWAAAVDQHGSLVSGIGCFHIVCKDMVHAEGDTP